MKFHITPDGPRKCTAKVNDCRYSSTHYDNEVEAYEAFSKNFESNLPKEVKKKKKEVTRSFSIVTNLCEESLYSDDGKIEEISLLINKSNDKNRPKLLRGKNINEISSILKESRNSFSQIMALSYGDNFTIESGNKGGNSSTSDLRIIKGNGEIVNIELKFGYSTNSASGIKRISNILKTDAFSINHEDRVELIDEFIKDQDSVLEILKKKMISYRDRFNSNKPKVNSLKLYDLLKSSGKEGNSLLVDEYRIFNFKENKDGILEVSETKINIKKYMEWEVVCFVNEVEGESIRLGYYFTNNDDNIQRTVRLLYNNKNSNRVKIKGNLVKIPSKLQTGAGSYNVWYSES